MQKHSGKLPKRKIQSGKTHICNYTTVDIEDNVISRSIIKVVYIFFFLLATLSFSNSLGLLLEDFVSNQKLLEELPIRESNTKRNILKRILFETTFCPTTYQNFGSSYFKK